MSLASFALITSRWKPAKLFYNEYETYLRLAEYLSKDTFHARIDTIRHLIDKEYPHAWVDTHLFAIAIMLVIIAAAFAIVARAVDLAIWYPLLILILPALIAYWTTRRRGLQFVKLAQFHDALQTCLREFTLEDTQRRARWSYHRLRDHEPIEPYLIDAGVPRSKISLVIEIMYSEMEPQDEHLPPYNAAARDIVLDVGPSIEEISTVTIPEQCRWRSENRSAGSHVMQSDNETGSVQPVSPPPDYLQTEFPDCAPVAPPAYQETRPASMPRWMARAWLRSQ